MLTDAASSSADLPEACIAHILSFTSPRDACRLSLLSSTFCSAAKSDALWDSFLPPDLVSILSRSSPPPPTPSKKHLYLFLSDNPLLIEDGLKSFWLDKPSGKKCYMLSARNLFICWGDTPMYWAWTSVPEARFEEVAELLDVCWLEIKGRINTRMLSPSTLYAAYLVFNLTADAYGFQHRPVKVSIGIAGDSGNPTQKYLIFPIPSENLDLQYPNRRADGWLEIKLGDFFSEGGDDEELEMTVLGMDGVNWKRGLIIQGFEIRPN